MCLIIQEENHVAVANIDGQDDLKPNRRGVRFEADFKVYLFVSACFYVTFRVS